MKEIQQQQGWWWIYPTTSLFSILYAATLIFGLIGNLWALTSVWRSRRLASCGGNHTSSTIAQSSASNRLRHYIGLLAFVDTLVSLALLPRIVLAALPQAGLSIRQCQYSHVVGQLLRFSSLGCLACIGLERYFTVRKPFARASAMHRALNLGAQLLILAMLLAAGSMAAANSLRVAISATELNRNNPASGNDSTASSSTLQFGNVLYWLLVLTPLLFLATITASYTQILLHVKRTFWQRKCRSYENQLQHRLSFALLAPSQHNLLRHHHLGQQVMVKIRVPSSAVPTALVAGGRAGSADAVVGKKPIPLPTPRYMRQMTTTIVRIAIFHALCWLPYCVLQLLPKHQRGSSFDLSASIIEGMDEPIPSEVYSLDTTCTVGIQNYRWDGMMLTCLKLAADWLTYASSAGNWVLYAAMNRELRTLLDANKEKKKRSTFSYTPQVSPIAASHPMQQHASSFGSTKQRLRLSEGLRRSHSSNSLPARIEVEVAAAVVEAGICCWLTVAEAGIYSSNNGSRLTSTQTSASISSRSTAKTSLAPSLDRVGANLLRAQGSAIRKMSAFE